MELFHRRYLCFFAFLFLLASVCCIELSIKEKQTVLIALFVAVTLALLLYAFIKSWRFGTAAVFFSLLFVLGAVFNSLMFIDIPRENAEKYIHTSSAVGLTVLEAESYSENEAQYIVRIDRINGDEVSIKARMYWDISSPLEYGDKLISRFEISGVSQYESNREIILTLDLEKAAQVFYDKEENVNYLSFNGIARICKNVREGFKEHIDKIYGEAAGLVKGFLINDRSDISGWVISDFRRSGITHMLAVSGMHITLLLGSLELLLKKIYVSKGIRCAIISVLALLLLVLTDFSGSAVRAVLMLYSVYVSYLFYEDHDAVTSLFCSIFVIVFISPQSVYDLGMWMSFFATLGLVTVYAYIDSKLPRVKREERRQKSLFVFLLWLVRAASITLVANFFLLPIIWMAFGEISLSTLLANLLLSPIVALFLPLCAIGAIIGGIPVINGALVNMTLLFEELILYISDMFANMPSAVLSLRYPFAFWLVMLFTVSLAVLLVLELKHKSLVLIPSAVFILAFGICLTVFTVNSSPQMRYIEGKGGEMLFYDKAAHSAICDMTEGNGTARMFSSNRNPYATEIEYYVISKCNEGYVEDIEAILSKVYIRKLYIPLTEDEEQLRSAYELYSLAEKYGSDVIFYSDVSATELFGELTFNKD